MYVYVYIVIYNIQVCVYNIYIYIQYEYYICICTSAFSFYHDHFFLAKETQGLSAKPVSCRVSFFFSTRREYWISGILDAHIPYAPWCWNIYQHVP